MLVDTHCHIHEADYPLDREATLQRATEAGVPTLICVGTTVQSSADAATFASSHTGVYAALGVHPHESNDGYEQLAAIPKIDKVVAIGEIGLDYFYGHSPKDIQLAALRYQLDLAVQYNLPVIFHVRNAFEDFWPVLNDYPTVRGVLHSFTDTQAVMERAVARGLYIGVNGISTFTKDPVQQAMFDAIPLDKILFETDAPFLTPSPLRGKVNEPAFVRNVAEFHATRRDLSLEAISRISTANAMTLFALT